MQRWLGAAAGAARAAAEERLGTRLCTGTVERAAHEQLREGDPLGPEVALAMGRKLARELVVAWLR